MRLDKTGKVKDSFIQFVKFGIVGLSNTVIALITYYLFLYLGCHYLLANVIAWLVSVFNAYYWNHRYVFQSDTHWFRVLVKTYLSYGVSFLFGTVLLVTFVELLGISDKIAPLLTLIITIPTNFLMNKFWAFK